MIGIVGNVDVLCPLGQSALFILHVQFEVTDSDFVGYVGTKFVVLFYLVGYRFAHFVVLLLFFANVQLNYTNVCKYTRHLLQVYESTNYAI